MVAVTGLNHVTLAVRDVPRSVAFYCEVLGCVTRASWDSGAYLEAGSLWLCLSRDDHVRSSPHPDYTHVAFSVTEVHYRALSERLKARCTIWRDNLSEGASTYFLDPDGHKLEVHVGTLESRLAHYRQNPPPGFQMSDRPR